MNRRSFALLFAIAALLRFLLIWIPPLWYDENYSLLVARLPSARFWQAIVGDVHPPLYYLIIRPIAQIVAAPWAIRIPSLVFSLAALWLAWKLFEQMQLPRLVSSAALVLMTVLPVQLWFAQEARMYALLEALVLLALYAGHLRKWTLFTWALIGMVYTQNYGLFYAVIIGLYLLIRDRNDFAALFRAAQWTGLAWAPWFLIMREQMQNISESYWIAVTFTGPGMVLGVLQQLFFMSILPLGLFIPAWITLFVALIAGTIGIVRHRWGILLLAFGPMLIAIIASLVWQPVLLWRPLIASAPFLYLVACWPLRNLYPFPTMASKFLAHTLGQPDFFEAGFRKKRQTLLYLSVFTIPLFFAGVISFYPYAPDLKGTRFLAALDYVKAHWQDGDAIYYTDDGPMINAAPYTAGLPQFQMPLCDKVYGSLSPATRSAIGIPLDNFTQVQQAYRRVWVFAPVSPLHPECYLTQISAITHDEPPLVPVDDNQFITSGVWLEER